MSKKVFWVPIVAFLFGIVPAGCAGRPASDAPASASLPPSGGDEINAPIADAVGAELKSLLELYKWFHANPELSLKEENTSRRFAAELRAAGWTVTERVGGRGVVGVTKNGEGPPAIARTDVDG